MEIWPVKIYDFGRKSSLVTLYLSRGVNCDNGYWMCISCLICS